MTVYVVTWNINGEPERRYDEVRAGLIAKLDKYDSIRDESLESVCFLATDIDVERLYDDISEPLDHEDDTMLISSMHAGEFAGQLEDKLVDWVQARIGSG